MNAITLFLFALLAVLAAVVAAVIWGAVRLFKRKAQ